MSPYNAGSSAKPAKCLSIAIVAILLASCAPLTTPSKIDPEPLVIASCPPSLGPLADDSFGATTEKLGQVAGIYHRCRAAAMAGRSP